MTWLVGVVCKCSLKVQRASHFEPVCPGVKVEVIISSGQLIAWLISLARRSDASILQHSKLGCMSKILNLLFPCCSRGVRCGWIRQPLFTLTQNINFIPIGMSFAYWALCMVETTTLTRTIRFSKLWGSQHRSKQFAESFHGVPRQQVGSKPQIESMTSSASSVHVDLNCCESWD